MKMKDKTSFQLSNSTIFRQRDPTNAQTAYRAPSMVFDHSVQVAELPDGSRDALIESTHTFQKKVYRTMNSNGKPLALKGISVGGAPDLPTRPFASKRRGK